MAQEFQILKPQVLRLDVHKKDLKPDQAFYLLNFQNWVTLNTNKTGNISKGNQFPANRPACDMQVPAGENYCVGAYYSILTNETYGFIYNTNGVHFISRINSVGDCQIVYYGACLPLSADPKRMITDFRCWMKYDRTCHNRAGKELYFVTGEFEGTIDVEASIATGNFTTPFFQRCGYSGCAFLETCVPDPPTCPTGFFPFLNNDTELSLSNNVLNKGFQFRYKFVYYDGRESIWSKESTLFYQDSLGFTVQPAFLGRSIRLRIPIGNPLVSQIEIAVSENNANTWRKIAVIEKYKKYNNSQEKWYERELAELTGYSDIDCSFDYTFYNDNIGETIDPAEIKRNFNTHPRGAQGLLPLSLKSGNNASALGYYNYIKGNCPLDAIQSGKFKVTVGGTNIAFTDGPKFGGRYSYGFVLHGDCGRYSFVNGTQIVNMPLAQNATSGGFPEMNYDFTGMVLPDWVTSVSIVRTPNLNGFELQWKVDSLQRVNGNIILTIQTLNDYNESHFFKSNTTYQWVDGDRIEFIRNGPGGGGALFTTAVNGLLNYAIVNPFADTTLSSLSPIPLNFANQLVIKDDGRLNGLIPGALIELQRPKQITDNLPYYEICANIPVANGFVTIPTGTFRTFDTYYVWRLIQGIYIKFEHTSPNDLWSVTRVTDQGRVWVANQFEDEKRYGRNMTINSPTVFNRFGDLEKVFPDSQQGDMTAIGIYDGQIGVAIGEHDSFRFQVNDDFLRIGSDGIVRAAPADAIVSDPQPQISGQFGCQYDHIGSVLFGENFIFWDDVERQACVKHDFNGAQDVGVEKVQLYFRVRLQELETHNRSVTNDLDKLRICVGYNRNDGTVMHTIKKLRDSGINNEYKPFQKTNDTLVFYPDANEWLGFISPTPEAYSQYNLFDGKGCAFITYLNGVPYYHPVTSDRYNEFFGVACDEVVGVSINQNPNKVKRYLAAEIQSEMLWFSPEITTDKDGFVSEIPPAKVIKDGRKWNFNFLSNRNSSGGIYSTNPNQISDICMGYFCAVTLVRDNSDALKYNSTNDAKRIKYNEADLFIFKYVFVESSGFTSNLKI